MNIVDNLKSRVNPSWREDESMKDIVSSLDTVFSFFSVAANKRRELSSDGSLSDKGVETKLQQYLDASITPAIKRYERQVEETQLSIAEMRAALMRPSIDKTDAAGAVLRQETRTYLRGLSAADRISILMNDSDPMFLTAVLEAPSELSGLTAEMREQIEAAYLQHAHPEETARLQERAEVAELLGVSLSMLSTDIRNALSPRSTEAA